MDLAPIDPDRPEYDLDVQEQVNINIKYEGYIKRQLSQVKQFKKMEKKRIPEDIDYEDVGSLRIEAKQKLSKIRYFCIADLSGTDAPQEIIDGEIKRKSSCIWNCIK